MTLEEAIKHAEEVAEEHTKYNRYGGFESCDECAAEHIQLAEWLKDYRRLLEQESFMNKPCVAHQVCHEDKVKVLDKIRAEIEQTFLDNGAIRAGMSTALNIIDKYREVRNQMQIVIDIPKDTYKDIIESGFIERGFIWDEDKEIVVRAVKEGTPLPKGHGRLIDADEIQFENTEFDTYSDYCIAFDAIDEAESIIEADETESEE